jgi:TetR/AcrR family transcriptional regulator, tetracycline repressor protein
VPFKLNRNVIAREGLRQLAEDGIDGLTMRSLAAAVGVQAPTLYWHVKNKRDLLDAMADVIATDVAERLRDREATEPIEDWLADTARSLRAAMLRYRDGARVFVGSVTPSAVPLNEAVLAELTREGYSLERAAQAGLTMVHYVTGSVIEEQARAGLDYAQNPYGLEEVFDRERFPLSARAFGVTFNPDADAGFEAGLAILLAGIAAIAKT